MTELQEVRAYSAKTIRRVIDKAPSNWKVYQEFQESFPGFLRTVSDEEILEWWSKYVDGSIIRGHYLRDGWLSGVDYGDC